MIDHEPLARINRENRKSRVTVTPIGALGQIGLRVLAFCIACTAAVSGCSEESTPKSTPQPFDANVTISLKLGNGHFGWDYVDDAGDYCVGDGTYEYLSQDAQLVVEDKAGRELAQTTLGVGRYLMDGLKTDDFDDQKFQCVFEFTVSEIPGGVGPYSIGLSNEGNPTTFTEAQAKDLQLEIVVPAE